MTKNFTIFKKHLNSSNNLKDKTAWLLNSKKERFFWGFFNHPKNVLNIKTHTSHNCLK